MEMIRSVIKIGADLTTQAGFLVKQISRLLELDTDGI